MLAVTGPDGTKIRTGRFGKGTAGLDGPGVSVQQFEVLAVDGIPDVLQLLSLGTNPLVVAHFLPDGSEVLQDVLEQGESALLKEGTGFYLPSRRSTTTFIVQADSTRKRHADSPPADTADDRILHERDTKRARWDSNSEAGPSSLLHEPPEVQPAFWAAPFSLLRVQGIPDAGNKQPMGARLGNFVCGSIKWVLISNFQVDWGWLLSACPDLTRAEAIVLVHGESHPAMLAFLKAGIADSGLEDRTTVHAPPLPIAWGTHHSKAFLVAYEEGVRVIVHTANLLHSDNNFKSQGLWMQDFPLKDAASPASSQFEKDLLDYVKALGIPGEAGQRADMLIKLHDFASARVKLLCSRPGYHQETMAARLGHMGLRTALQKERFEANFIRSPAFCQFSSMGSLDAKWLHGEFQDSLSAGKTPEGQVLPKRPGNLDGLKIIWPTAEEVQNSIEGWAAGRSIPGVTKNVHKPFLKPLLHRFGGAPAGRQRAMPHIKSFGRYQVDDQGVRLPWLVLTSHNLSKAAWGALQKNGTQLMIRSYEMGVLFLPSLEASYRAHRHCGFCCTAVHPVQLPTGVQDQPKIEFWARRSLTEDVPADPSKVLLPLPYHLPPHSYGSGDQPWVADGNFVGLDSNGRGILDEFPPLYGCFEAD